VHPFGCILALYVVDRFFAEPLFDIYVSQGTHPVLKKKIFLMGLFAND